MLAMRNSKLVWHYAAVSRRSSNGNRATVAEISMRHVALLAAIGTMIGTQALPLGPAAALPAIPLGPAASEALSPPVEHIACHRRGWHGWGWYPCQRAYAPVYGRHIYPGKSSRFSYRGSHRYWR
jgi:hypothetical protein